ncbi:hypothetical protein BGZ61DRAFT_367206 [Ilyonectria robusta]|uniref:uncharacterized protein n=1 Tax=Ilyonectria robusta TaxID=1079257 RepID=UPI001E8D04E4|nr:uncharacterized protein BGZ61DRAFT_367206 [Ilyonectria robusta]KAH8664921.1 hypothetical protein BGZ61DRAFT_367206 [Ilyonectria robusta]
MGDAINETSENVHEFTLKDSPAENQRRLRVVVIGAGFSGICTAIRISQRLRNIDLAVYEANPEPAGVWWLNRYPGLACDIPSYSYQFSFAPNPYWSSLYAPGPEIRAYMQDVAERFGATRHIKTSHKVTSGTWDGEKKLWKLVVLNLETGKTFEDTANILISAKGGLNQISWPKIKGLKSFSGKLMHSGAWDEDFDLRNKRVGIIGNGSSAIQIVPAIQPLEGLKLSCFARSPTWIASSFGDRVMVKLGMDPKNSKCTEEQIGAKAAFEAGMRQRLEGREDLIEPMIPKFAAGCRRLTPGPGYLEALKQENVAFITTPIQEVTPEGIKLTAGDEVKLDVLICATGYDLEAPPTFELVGRNGTTLANKWKPHFESYISMAVDEFPNFFIIGGPNSSLGSGSLTSVFEAQANYAVKVIRKMQKEDYSTIEPKKERVNDFSQYIDEYFKGTVYTDECSSWYRAGKLGTRIVALWPGSSAHCLEILRSPRWEDFNYESADKTGNHLRWMGNGWSMTLTEGDPSWFLDEDVVDVPDEGEPENSKFYKNRPFSH